MNVCLLLEEVKTKEILNFFKTEELQGGDVDIVALTPVACFELDKLDMKYKTPDEYFLPERIEGREESKKGLYSSIFSIYILESCETFFYWSKFLEKYFNEHPDVERVYYIGSEFAHLINYCFDSFGEDFILI